LIGVSKKYGRISGALCEQRNVVKTSVKWGAVGNDTVVHLVHARVQTGATRRTWCALAVVLGESYALLCKPIEVWCFYKGMASNRKTVCAKLIQGDEQDIE
jgi:hypothetical protein